MSGIHREPKEGIPLEGVGGTPFRGTFDVGGGVEASLVNQVLVAGITYEILAFIHGGEKKGLFTLRTEDFTGVAFTLRDGFEATTGWVLSSVITAVVAVPAPDKTEGTNALKFTFDGTAKGKDTGGMEKPISPTQDWSSDVALFLDVKSDQPNLQFDLIIHQGVNSHTFPGNGVGTAYNTFQFDLADITEHDKTAIDKIEIVVDETDDLKIVEFIFFDNLRTADAFTAVKILSQIRNDSKEPFQRNFKVPKTVVGQSMKFLQVRALNDEGASGEFTGELDGRKINT